MVKAEASDVINLMQNLN